MIFLKLKKNIVIAVINDTSDFLKSSVGIKYLLCSDNLKNIN